MKFPNGEELNFQEQTIGFVYGLCFAFKFHWWAILLAFVTSWLWSAGGAKREDGGNKLYRRVGCSLLPCLVAYAMFHKTSVFISFPIAFIIQSFGYGVPDDGDNGSWLGRLWYEATSEDKVWTNVFTRLTIYIALALSFIPIWVV